MQTLIERNQVKECDKWDLSVLYKESSLWEEDFKKVESSLNKLYSFKNTLSKSATHLKEALDYIITLSQTFEKMGDYAFLKEAEDLTDNSATVRLARFSKLNSEFQAALSYFEPELLSIDDKVMESFLKDEILKDYVLYITKILRFKPHTLSEKEERILAFQEEIASSPSNIFSALNDGDMDFGEIEFENKKLKVTHATFSSFQESENRELRRKSYEAVYKVYDNHKNTLSKLYSSQVNQDLFDSKIRNYNSTREMELFPDKIPVAVYDNLIKSVHNNLDTIHEYYDYIKTKLNLDIFRQYDKYAPVIKDVKINHTYDEAVDLLEKALSPLGEEYVSVLIKGLKSGWVDKYENKGKHSGAFSAGSYSGIPYILMNFREDSIESVFTLAHEAGHSMHSYYSVKNNKFQDYGYTIFEAEVASTFNERLLFHYMMKNENKKEVKAFLLNKEINRFVSTIFRQTMFAEFEHIIHKEAESGNPTSLELIRETYKSLLKKYFGEKTALEETSDLEAMRIPHFYRPFYVYKYATGLSAAVSLSNGVLENPQVNQEKYLAFLKSGGSKYPLENLKMAGADMESSYVVENAMKSFRESFLALKSLH